MGGTLLGLPFPNVVLCDISVKPFCSLWYTVGMRGELFKDYIEIEIVFHNLQIASLRSETFYSGFYDALSICIFFVFMVLYQGNPTTSFNRYLFPGR